METEGTRPKRRTTFYIDPNVLHNFKKVCFREDVSMSNKVERFMARYNAVHMEGNPQLTMLPFIGKIKKTCFRCDGKFKVLHHVKFISGLKAYVCKECLEDYENRRLIVKHLK